MLYSHKGAIKIEKPQNIYYGMIFSFRIYKNVTSCLVKIQWSVNGLTSEKNTTPVHFYVDINCFELLVS